MFSLVLGTTVYAVATVLGVYMGGLALGSWIFGRIVDRPKANGFRLYAHMLNIFSKSNWKQARNRISELTKSFELLPVIIDEAKIIVYNS